MHLIKYIKYLLFVLMLYAFFFTPALKSIGANIPSAWLLYPISLIVFVKEYKSFVLFYRIFQTEIVLILLIVFYTFIRVLIGGDVGELKGNFLCIFELILVPFSILVIGNRMKLESQKDFMTAFFVTGTVAIGITLMCLLNPELHTYVRDNIMIFDESDYLYEVSYRGFGIAAQMTSHYAFILGIMISLALFYRNNVRWFTYVIPFAFIAAIVNARTGVLIGAAGVGVFLLFSRKFVASVFVGFFAVILYTNFMEILSLFDLGAWTSKWLEDFFIQTEKITSGNTNGTIMDEFSNMIFTPETIPEWIVGRGKSIFHGGDINGQHVNSDIGFINQLLFGGLLYIIPLYYIVFFMSKRLYKAGHRTYSVYLIVAFLIINFKGNFLIYTPSFKFVMLTYYVILLQSCGPSVLGLPLRKRTQGNKTSAGISR